MEASGLILNLVRKGAARTDAKEKCSGEQVTSTEDVASSSDQRASIRKPYPCNLIEESRDDCTKERTTAGKTIFKVSLRTADEDFSSDKENGSRKKIRAEPRQIPGSREKSDEQEKIFVLQQLGRSQIRPEGFPAFLCIDGRIADSNGVKRKIPRPANAFMLFANEWRKKLAAENPRESNKDISVRLGILWKNMAKDVKEKYFALARKVDAEHKRKYPEMDCCNYVEAYAAGGHFYQQQHYFCYDNPNPVYAGYEPAPIAAAIDNNPRYNGPVPPGYSADYVYNPKEARLRKAMREQSRELSRRSILQSAIARAGVITGPVGSAGFLDHQHRFGCVTASGLPINPPVESDRVAEPWFQSAPRPKPIHSPRMADWYGEPIDRLQVHAAGMHQRATALDKCKDPAIRSTQTSVAPGGPDCGPSFPAAGYPVDFADVNRERELRRQENMQEYGEFTDGQKWHPYQNGGGSHQHPRSSHPSQMSGILHPNVQSPSSHGHGPWGQFCHGVLPHVPTMPRSIGVRGPRHTVLLRDRLTGRHCGFTEESARMPYAPNKIDVESMRASYSSPEHQMPRLLESSVDSMVDSTATSRTRRDDEGPRWEPNTINNGISMENLTPTTQESSAPREKEPRRCVDRFEPKKKAVSKQPLPGFHQAFGSTEIGRFSRSEFFVNMVGGENGGNVEVPDTESPDLHPKTYLPSPVLFPFTTRSCGILGASRIHRINGNGEIVSRIVPNECCWFAGQQRCGGPRMPDNIVNCTAFLDCSHRARDKEWFGRSNVVHPSGMQAILRQRENYETYQNERNNESYIVIGTGSISNNNSPAKNNLKDETEMAQMNLKLEEEGSPKRSTMLPAKQDENVLL